MPARTQGARRPASCNIFLYDPSGALGWRTARHDPPHPNAQADKTTPSRHEHQDIIDKIGKPILVSTSRLLQVPVLFLESRV